MKQTYPILAFRYLALASLLMVPAAAWRPATARPGTQAGAQPSSQARVQPGAASKPAARISYHASFAKALKAAQKSKRPLLVYFHASWCSPCKAMEDTVLTDSRVVSAVKKWEAVSADMDEETALAARLKVERPPTLVFLTPQGRVTSRHEGYADVDALLKVLRIAQTKASPTQAAPSKDARPRSQPSKLPQNQKKSSR